MLLASSTIPPRIPFWDMEHERCGEPDTGYIAGVVYFKQIGQHNNQGMCIYRIVQTIAIITAAAAAAA
jgi:hypothetical protein